MSQSVKPIVITDSATGNQYTIEYNRESVLFAESRGFKFADVGDYLMTKLPELWFYGFRMHHKSVSRQKTDALLDGIGALPEGFLERLGALYAEPYNQLLEGNPDETPFVTVTL